MFVSTIYNWSVWTVSPSYTILCHSIAGNRLLSVGKERWHNLVRRRKHGYVKTGLARRQNAFLVVGLGGHSMIVSEKVHFPNWIQDEQERDHNGSTYRTPQQQHVISIGNRIFLMMDCNFFVKRISWKLSKKTHRCSISSECILTEFQPHFFQMICGQLIIVFVSILLLIWCLINV